MRRGDLRHRPKSRSRILQNPGQGAFLEHAPSTVVCIGLPELALGGGTRVLVTYAAMLTHAVANIMPVIDAVFFYAACGGRKSMATRYRPRCGGGAVQCYSTAVSCLGNEETEN